MAYYKFSTFTTVLPRLCVSRKSKSFFPWPVPCLSSTLERKLIVPWKSAGILCAFNIVSAAPSKKPPNLQTIQSKHKILVFSRYNKGEKAGNDRDNILYCARCFPGGWGSCSARCCEGETLSSSCTLHLKISEVPRLVGLSQVASVLRCNSCSWAGSDIPQVCWTKLV